MSVQIKICDLKVSERDERRYIRGWQFNELIDCIAGDLMWLQERINQIDSRVNQIPKGVGEADVRRIVGQSAPGIVRNQLPGAVRDAVDAAMAELDPPATPNMAVPEIEGGLDSDDRPIIGGMDIVVDDESNIRYRASVLRNGARVVIGNFDHPDDALEMIKANS
jgi:hypothetical protein